MTVSEIARRYNVTETAIQVAIDGLGPVGPNAEVDVIIRRESPGLSLPAGVVGAVERWPHWCGGTDGRAFAVAGEWDDSMACGAGWFRGTGEDAPIRVRLN